MATLPFPRRRGFLTGAGSASLALLGVLALSVALLLHPGTQRAELLDPAGVRAPGYVNGVQARADLGAFFDTLQDRSWREGRAQTALEVPRPQLQLSQVTRKLSEVERQLKVQIKDKPGSARVEAVMAAVQKKVGSLKQELAKAMSPPPVHPEHEEPAADKMSNILQVVQEPDALRTGKESFKHELARISHGQKLRDYSSASEDTSSQLPFSNIKDKAHCLPPNVWVDSDGSCRSSPRGRKDIAQQEGKACAGGTDSSACKDFKKKEREMEQEYDRDLKQNGGYAYTTDRARGAGGRSSNQRGAGGGAGGSGAGGRSSNQRGAGGGAGGSGAGGGAGGSGAGGRSSNQRGAGGGAGGSGAGGRSSNQRGARGAGGGAGGRGAGGRSSNQRGARGAGGSGAGGRGDGDGIGSLDEDLAKFLGNGEDGGGAEELHKLASEISDLDEWSKDTDPYEFITQPQRFPHEDGADLGDNYIAGLTDKHGGFENVLSDKLELPGEASMRQPALFSTFFGKETAASPPTALKPFKSLESMRAKNANADWYSVDDVYPSTRQMHQQVEPGLTRQKMREVAAKRHDPLENPKIKQRWRKDPNCVGTSCSWRAVLEDEDQECDEEHCSESCKGESCGETQLPVRVCGPLGCDEATPVAHAADPLKEQLSKGAIDGKADPFGAGAIFSDVREPAVAASLDLGLRSHFRANGGEPLGDAGVRGWQMHNGVGYRAQGFVARASRAKERPHPEVDGM